MLLYPGELYRLLGASSSFYIQLIAVFCKMIIFIIDGH